MNKTEGYHLKIWKVAALLMYNANAPLINWKCVIWSSINLRCTPQGVTAFKKIHIAHPWHQASTYKSWIFWFCQNGMLFKSWQFKYRTVLFCLACYKTSLASFNAVKQHKNGKYQFLSACHKKQCSSLLELSVQISIFSKSSKHSFGLDFLSESIKMSI